MLTPDHPSGLLKDKGMKWWMDYLHGQVEKKNITTAEAIEFYNTHLNDAAKHYQDFTKALDKFVVEYEDPMDFNDEYEEVDEYDEEYYPEGGPVERTLVLLKPDAYERNLMGEIINILDGKELNLIGAKQVRMDKKMVEKHYQNHVGKGFFPDLVQFMTSGPCFALVYEGTKACAVVRQLIGEKHPGSSPPGSIRGKFASEYPRNLVHGSDDMHQAEQEIHLYFKEDELFGSFYKKHMKQIMAQADAEKKAQKDIILAKPIVPGDLLHYPAQVLANMVITNPSGHAYRVLGVKKKQKGQFEITMCNTQYVDDPIALQNYKVTMTYDDQSFTDNWKLLTYAN